MMTRQGLNGSRQPDRAFSRASDLTMACTGRSYLPPGLSRSREDQVRFDTMKDLKKFLNNYCCVPGSSLAGALPGPAFGV